jgi:uroporphyrinogen-III synthase
MRVLISRAEPEASALADVIACCGHSPVLAPLAALASRAVDWPQTLPEALIFTSGNAPLHVTHEKLHLLPVFAIGPHTAAAASHAGFVSVVAHADGQYATLLSLISAAPYRRLWHIGGRDVRHDMVADLAQRSLSCHAFTVYEMISATALPLPAQTALQNRALDMTLIFSPASAERALILLGGARHWLPAWVMSEAIAAPLRLGGWRYIHVSSAPNKRTLLAEAGLMCDEAEYLLKGAQDDR